MAVQTNKSTTRFSSLRVHGYSRSTQDAQLVAKVPLTVKGVPSQTGDLVQCLDSTGAVMAKITAAGAMTVASTMTVTGALTSADSSAFGIGGALRVARAKYSFAVDGGVVGLITPATTATLPINSIVLGGLINVTTACTSGGSATIAVGTSAGSSASSLKTATAVATFSSAAMLATVPVFTAASAVKLSAAGSITVTVATADLTAGIFEVSLFYIVAAA